MRQTVVNCRQTGISKRSGNRLTIGIHQATGTGGRGILKYHLPLAENFWKIPPEDFEKRRYFVPEI